MQKSFYSNGKLLLTAEYAVLDGAVALALPTKYGQSLTIQPSLNYKLKWKSLDHNKNVWFEGEFIFEQVCFPFVYDHSQTLEDRSEASKRLLNILYSANQLNNDFLSDFLDSGKGLQIITQIDFPKDWGLGTSSTLINNIADWAQVDAYELLRLTFGGSGYDIACAQYNSPLTYTLSKASRVITPIQFDPDFKDQLYFVYLNKKQNSRDSITHYKENKHQIDTFIPEINAITHDIIDCKTLSDFAVLITAHELLISSLIKTPRVKETLFPDYDGAIKSLGGWGGDFILVTSEEKHPKAYFESKGYNTIIPYSDMVL